MLKYLSTGEYAFKYDEQLKNTKREQAKRRKEEREAKTRAAGLKQKLD